VRTRPLRICGPDKPVPEDLTGWKVAYVLKEELCTDFSL
jgi:hypothetical protein